MTAEISNRLLEDYIVGLEQHKELPVGVDFPDAQNTNEHTIRMALDVAHILENQGVSVVTLGSVAVGCRLGDRYNGKRLHDVDFAMPAGQLPVARQALRSEGFTVWDERRILETVRNSGGGYGRVHNEGAASDRYVDRRTGLPVWFGLFSYEQSADAVTFHEHYTVTAEKVLSAIHWLKSQDISPNTKEQLDSFTRTQLKHSDIEQLEHIYASEGVTFWDILFSPDINAADIARRSNMDACEADTLFEIKMTKRFGVPADTYFGVNRVPVFGGELPVLSLEGSYMPMNSYFPHYLGKREKYVAAARTIIESGLLDSGRLAKYEAIFAGREVRHTPTRSLTFSVDRIQDPATLRAQPNVAALTSRNQVFYPSLLFENIHVAQRKDPRTHAQSSN